MNRCQKRISSLLRLAYITLAALLVGLATSASAQTTVRPFPANVQRGVMVVVAPPIIQINGKTDSLSPGARIRGMNNFLVMSGSIIGQSLTVNYLRNPTGEVHEVWVLTPAEAALPLPVQQ